MINEVQISCTFPTETTLYMAYMPFLSGGGLFVCTNQILPLGTVVQLSVNLLNEPEVNLVGVKVAWVTPRGAQGNKPAGLGFQFISANSADLKNKIETLLAGMLKSTQMTYTM